MISRRTILLGSAAAVAGYAALRMTATDAAARYASFMGTSLQAIDLRRYFSVITDA